MPVAALIAECAEALMVAAGIALMFGGVLPKVRPVAAKVLAAGVGLLLFSLFTARIGIELPVLPAFQWWWLIPVFVVAPFVAIGIGARILIGLMTLLFGRHVGERAVAHVAGVLSLHLIERLGGRRRGRAIPASRERDDASTFHHD